MSINDEFNDDLTQAEQDVLNDVDPGAEAGAVNKADELGGKEEDDGANAGKENKDGEDDKPAGEAGDDDSQRVVEDDEGSGEGDGKESTPDTTPEVAGAPTVDAGASDDDDDDGLGDFVPITPSKLPTLSAKELSALEAELTAIDEKFDEGDMSTKEYIAQRESAKGKINDHESAVKINTASIDANWRGAQSYFFTKNPVFRKNSFISSAFEKRVNALISDPSSNRMSDMEILSKCRKAVVADLKKDGIVVPGLSKSTAAEKADTKDTAAKAKAKAIRAAKDSKSGKKSEDLSDIPADSSIDGESWMDKLDKLATTSGAKYEEAIEALSPKDYDQYMAKH